MKLLITGAAGFLGRHVVSHFSRNHEVLGVYNKTKPAFPDLVKLVDSVDSLQDVPDVIILCHAAVSAGKVVRSQAELEESNVNFTNRVVSRFPDVPTIYCSTVSVFESAQQVMESSPVSPQSPYAQTKLDGERIVSKNPQSAIVRISSLYGPGMNAGTLIPNYTDQALSAGFIDVWGDGSRLQNYIHVHDVVRLLEAILMQNRFGKTLYLATAPASHSNLKIAQLISQLTDAQIRFVNQDNSVSAVYDNSVTQKSLNWTALVSLEDGISGYVRWVSNHRK